MAKDPGEGSSGGLGRSGGLGGRAAPGGHLRVGRAPGRLGVWEAGSMGGRVGAYALAQLGCRAVRRVLRRLRPRAVQRAQLLEVIFASVGVFRYFCVTIGSCSSLPVMAVFTLSFQVAPSLKVTRRLKLHL